MSAKACRICLATDIKLFSINREPLKTAVDIILTLNGDPTSFPQFMCYQCSAIIIKCLRFIEKSRLSETILYNIYDMQGEVPQSALRAVNRVNLESNMKVYKCTPYSYIELHHIDQEDSSSSDSLMEIVNTRSEAVEDNETLILTFEEENTKLSDAASVDLESDLLMDAEGQESLFSYNVELKLESTKFESAIIPLLPEDDEYDIPIPVKKNNTKGKQIKPNTKKQEKNAKQPKTKDKPTNGLNQLKRRKKLKDFDKNLKEYFTVVLLTYEEQMSEIEARKHEPGFATSPYTCDKCFKFYRKSETYCNHMAEHDESRGPLECGVCKKMFAARSTLSRHIVCCHQRHYHCKLCPFTGKNRQALAHIKKHQGNETVTKCTLCKFAANNPSHLLRHIARRHERHARRCERCGKHFATERGYKLHVSRAHCKDKAVTTEYCCDICSLTMYKESDWEKHVETHAQHENEKRKFCDKCQETFINIEGLAEHNTAIHRSDNIYPVNCIHCNSVIHSSREYWRHVVRSHPSEKNNYHSPKRTFLCDICGRGFKSVTDLRLHGERHGGPARRVVPCGAPACPALFYDHYQARTHRKNVHTDKRPHVCPQCDLTFKIKSNLKRHMVVHTGERAYACSLCNKTFTQASSRDLHVKSVHYKIPPPTRVRKPTSKRNAKRRPGKAKEGTLETCSISIVEPTDGSVRGAVC